jgi:lysophospholipase L1-like esterase
MLRRLTLELFVLSLALPCLAVSTAIVAAQEKSAEKASKNAPAEASSKPDDRWEKELSALTAKDSVDPPPPGGIVFVGSSSIRLWDLKKSFPELPAINRGFGGSQLADSVRYADRIVTAYKPKTVVLYAGDNDLAAGTAPKSPEQIAKDFDDFVAVVRKSLPEAKIVYIAVKPSPSRWKLIGKQRETNRLIRERCEQGERLLFLDIEKPMLGSDGQPRAELFKADNLHMNDHGYAIWAELLEPHLK